MSDDRVTPSEFLRQLQSTQEMDQIESAYRGFAQGVRLYHQELRAAGFSKSEAMTLTLSFQQTMMIQNHGQQGKGNG